MLNRLKIENFKAWREADLTLGKVTGLFGTNSAGKSSLLQFLLLLKQTRNATDRGLVLDFGGPADLVNLGTFEDVVHQHDKNQAIGWLLKWTLPYQMVLEGSVGSNNCSTVQGQQPSDTMLGRLPERALVATGVGIPVQRGGLSVADEVGIGRKIRVDHRRARFRVRTQPGPSLAAAAPGESLPVSQPSEDIFSKRGLPR